MAAAAVGANTTQSSNLEERYFMRVDFPVPALPVTNKAPSFSKTASKDLLYSGIASISSKPLKPLYFKTIIRNICYNKYRGEKG
jgi:hypothetical protein